MGSHRSGNWSRVGHLDFEELIKKSLVIQIRFFDDPTIPDEKKVEYASKYLVRRVPEKLEMAVQHQLDSDQMKQLYDRIQQQRPLIIDATEKDTDSQP